jgi:uncharacterized Zn finger protein
MSNSVFDSHEITIACPNCKENLTEKLGILRESPAIKCASCGESIKFDASALDKGLSDADRSISEFKRKLSNIKL